MSYVSEVAADAPLGWWRLNDTAGAGTALDGSGNNRHGSVIGTTFGVAGLLTGDTDKAASFAGGGQINLGAVSAFNLTTGTYEAWFRTTSNDATYRTLIAGNGRQGLYVRNGKLISHDRGVDRDTGRNVADGAVHHAAIAFSATDNATLIYLDGALVMTTTVKQTNFNDPLGIANNPNASTPFVGTIDEVAIYSGQLSAARVAAHYTAGTIAPTVPGQLSVYNGSAFVRKPMKVYNGSAFQTKPVKRWNGGSWVLA